MSFKFNATANIKQFLSITLSNVFLGINANQATLFIEELRNGVWTNLTGVGIANAGTVQLSYTPTQSQIRFRIVAPANISVTRICLQKPVLITRTSLVDICSGSGDRYRFGFNGQEKVNEWSGVGNHLDFEFRGYDSRIGKFISLDPVANKYPWNSPFAFAENIVINGVDAEGREWKSQHKWSDKITDKSHISLIGEGYTNGMTYKDVWSIMAPKLLKDREGKTFDCANLSIDVMVNYSYLFKLPVRVEDYKGGKDKDPTFDNNNFGFKNKNGRWQTFKANDWKALSTAIADNYGASDLFYNRKITTIKSFDKMKPGDLIGWKYPGNVFHSQTVSEVGDSFWFDFDEENDYYKTIQGSLHDGKGVQAFEKEYDIDDVKEGYGQDAKTQDMEWNTEFFDKN